MSLINHHWESYYSCVPPWDDREVVAAAIEYHIECEYFDRLTCGEDGIPKTSRQRIDVNKHATLNKHATHVYK